MRHGERIRYHRHRLRDLDPAAFDRLHSAMGTLMHDTVAATEDPAWADALWARRREPLRRDAYACVAETPAGLIGFMTYELFRVEGRTCVHLMSCYVDPAHHGRGVAFSLAARIGFAHFALRPFVNLWFTTGVINPLAVTAWRARAPEPHHLYPPLDGGRADPRLVRSATTIAAQRFPDHRFDPRTGVLRDGTLPRRGQVPDSGDPAVDRFFARQVDPSQGDTVLLVFDASRRVILRNLAELAAAAPRALRARPGRRRRRHGTTAPAR